MCASARRAASDPDLNAWGAMISSPWWKIIILSPVTSVTTPIQGAEIIFEIHVQVVQTTERDHISLEGFLLRTAELLKEQFASETLRKKKKKEISRNTGKARKR